MVSCCLTPLTLYHIVTAAACRVDIVVTVIVVLIVVVVINTVIDTVESTFIAIVLLGYMKLFVLLLSNTSSG